MRLAGKNALVTGAGTIGMGRAIALALAREGAEIALHYYDSAAIAEAAAEEMRGLGRAPICLQADLSDPAAGRDLVRRATRHFGQLDILVACAAVIVRKPLLETTDADLAAVLAVNVQGTFAVAQEAAIAMVARGRGGRIVIISSVNQQLAAATQSAYTTSKGATMQLAKSMALELAPFGITVNLIAPGLTETDFNRHVLVDPAIRRQRTAPIPLGRLAAPEDIAGAAVYLASDEAAYVTGTTITIDGGVSLA